MIDITSNIKPYISLMRLDKPTGIWLLLIPCLWGITLAANADSNSSNGFAQMLDYTALLKMAFLFFIGAVTMRSAGCIINDMADRKYDAQVERTKNRPLAAGDISIKSATVLLITLLTISLIIALSLGKELIILAILWLPLVIIYPFMKRITWWPQLFLGITFNAGVIFGWVAYFIQSSDDMPSMLSYYSTASISEHLLHKNAISALILYIGAISWTVAYDTIYAHQDKNDDMKIGVKSTAILFADKSKQIVAGLYSIFITAIAVSGYIIDVAVLFYIALIPVALHLAWQVYKLDTEDAQNCMKLFKSNVITGLLVLAAILAGS